MAKPDLSIIVPVYNVEKYLEKCILSILKQEYREFELILVDDGSTDRSLDVCIQYSRCDERIHVIHKENSGVMNARKAGFLYSCGRYISFIDSDDWIEPKFYNGLVECMAIGCDAVLMAGYRIDGVKNKQVRTGLRQGVYCKSEIRQMLAKGIVSSLWSKLFKRELLENNLSLIDSRVWRGEDFMTSYACLLDADKIMVKNSYQYHYVQHTTSAMHQYSDKNIENLHYFVKNAKCIRKRKESSFLDVVWNRQILMELLDVIRKEFEVRDWLLSWKEIDEMDRKFSRIRFSHLLLGEGLKTVSEVMTEKEMWIFKLYSIRAYILLNLYLKYLNKSVWSK